ncbi:suppressor of cytokine signaling 7 isoform X2 [Rhinatrema bivittatum]|uniref:suppressor of cytokine signaling 7 isoform X2 n=1 Tax=Rhinatrema bivittatum TaxID=194408 RepID=UPI00112E7D76|nr:suppressor of cytokine signaling 7 isoform X2 [Rhinatrema bivittatum]
MQPAELRDSEVASYRALSRLLGDEEAAAQRFPFPTRTRGSRPQLMVFRKVVRGEEASAEAVFCARHRCALEPGPSLELQLGALELQGGEAGRKGPLLAPGDCPCPAEETSDALLVLEGPESEAESPEISCSEEDLHSPGRGAGPPGGARPLLLEPLPSAPSQAEREKDVERRPCGRPSRGRPGSCCRKGSLKIRLTRLFRTKSCNGSGDTSEPRPGGGLATSAGSLTDVSWPRDKGQDSARKLRLSRTQSAFSPVSFSPLFTGETMSLVDVDISQQGLASRHPPTPPPPPRRSLSLLDTFPRVLPSRQTEIASSQPIQQLQCPLYRPDSNSFAASLRELEKCGWYWGPMNWEDAEMKLKGKPDGSFLVRDSSDPRYILSLSFRSQGITHHTRMEHYRGTFSLWCHPKFEDRCQSVVEFIKRAIMHSKNGKFLYFLRSRVPGLPPTPVQLLFPVSRFSNVKSLQHLCRFRIRQLVRIDHIPELPLPKPLISYLRKFYYYDPQEEVYLSLKETRQVSIQEPEIESST